MKLAVGIVPFLALLSSVEVLGWKENCKCFEEITRNKRRFCKNRRGLKGYGESGVGVGDAENSKYQNVVDLFYERGLSVEGMDGEQEENMDDTSNERDLIYDTESEFYDLFAEEFEEDTSELDDNEVDFADNLSSLGDDISGESRELIVKGCSRLKMWHKYAWSCWQFELKDREWCMSHREGSSTVRIEKCSNSSSQRVKLTGKSIRVNGKCLELGRGSTIYPKSCNSKNRRQHWKLYKVKGRGTEIRPAGNSRLCITQPHHPRSGEILRASRCSVPRRTFHRSAWWECDS
eukprot:scaffold57209_cov52-Attheya_sp.AAC.2